MRKWLSASARYSLLALAVWTASAAQARATCDPEHDSFFAGHAYVYEGEFANGSRIRVLLNFKAPNIVDGELAFAESKGSLPVSGTIDNNDQVQLSLHDPEGMVSAQFSGTMMEFAEPFRGRLTCEVMQGSWTDHARGKVTPLTLVISSSFAPYDPIVESRAVAFRSAVAAGRRQEVAGAIRYPIQVKIAGIDVSIQNEAELTEKYQQIFRPGFQQAIECAIPLLMFSREEGIMLGDGEVWFDYEGYVIALNNGPIILNSCKRRLRI